VIPNLSADFLAFRLVENAIKLRDSGLPPFLRGSLFVPRYFIHFDLAAIDLFLTPDTEGRPWHSGQALWQDIFFAVQTDAVSAMRDAVQRAANQPERVRIPVEITNGKFPFAHQLHFIDSVRRLLDCDFVPLTQ